MKLIGLIGEPAAGKSTVMKRLIAGLGEGEVVKEGLVVYTIYRDAKAMVAGKYEEGVTFCGTDVLSKGCGPKYREWLQDMNRDSDYDSWKFYFEGERFSNNKFLEFIFDEFADPRIYYLEADEDTLSERNANRSNQNETWRKGMKTRMKNLKKAYPVKPVDQGFTLP